MLSVRTTHDHVRRSRFWMRGLLLCVVFRALIPIGFMASSDPHAWITLCYGNTGSAQLLSLAEPEDNHSHHPDHHAHTQTNEHNHEQTVTEHSYCLFSSVSLNSPQLAASPVPIDPAKTTLPTSANQYLPQSHPFHLQFARAPPARHNQIA